jgi:hypothetical protein
LLFEILSIYRSKMEFISTPKGGRRLLLNSYGYVLDKKRGTSSYWRCELRKQCSVRCVTVNDVITDDPTEKHGHAPNPAKAIVHKTVAAIRDRARDSEEPTSSVIQNVTSNFPLAAVGQLPSRETLARMVRRKRKASEELITEDMLITSRGEEIITITDNDLGIYIITTENNLEMLSDSLHWFADGTFHCAPEDYQLYTIHALLNQSNKTIPLVYCILNNKDTVTYNRVLELLEEKRAFNPDSIMVDFETASINAFRDHFPNADLQGCLFHFGQCIWRKIQELGLQAWYNEPGGENALSIKQFNALAFVPINLVPDAFNALVDSLDDELDQLLADFLLYFQTTWIGIVQRGRRRNPTFPIALWNVHGRVADDLPRTNNSVEGWHNGFNARVGIIHPSPRKLFLKIRREMADFELLVEQHRLGISLPVTVKRYQDANERIKTLVNNFNFNGVLLFLRNIAHNI